MRVRDAARYLGISPEAGPVVWPDVRKAYIAAAARHHPDRGGDRDAWDRVLEAYRVLRTFFDRPQPCQACGGVGKIYKFARKCAETCQVCRGEGKLPSPVTGKML